MDRPLGQTFLYEYSIIFDYSTAHEFTVRTEYVAELITRTFVDVDQAPAHTHYFPDGRYTHISRILHAHTIFKNAMRKTVQGSTTNAVNVYTRIHIVY